MAAEIRIYRCRGSRRQDNAGQRRNTWSQASAVRFFSMGVNRSYAGAGEQPYDTAFVSLKSYSVM